MVAAGLLVVTGTGVVGAGTVEVLRVELSTVFHGAQPSVFTLEVADPDELEVVDAEVVEDVLEELVVPDGVVVVRLEDEEVAVVVALVVEELEDPQEAPALTEN